MQTDRFLGWRRPAVRSCSVGCPLKRSGRGLPRRPFPRPMLRAKSPSAQGTPETICPPADGLRCSGPSTTAGAGNRPARWPVTFTSRKETGNSSRITRRQSAARTASSSWSLVHSIANTEPPARLGAGSSPLLAEDCLRGGQLRLAARSESAMSKAPPERWSAVRLPARRPRLLTLRLSGGLAAPGGGPHATRFGRCDPFVPGGGRARARGRRRRLGRRGPPGPPAGGQGGRAAGGAAPHRQEDRPAAAQRLGREAGSSRPPRRAAGASSTSRSATAPSSSAPRARSRCRSDR